MAETVFETISRAYYDLTAAEKKTADYVMKHHDETQYMSIAELADASGVAEATVSRFCRRLGYKGYNAFKLAIANAAAVGRHGGDQLSGQILEDDSLEDMSRKLYSADLAAMAQTLEEIMPSNGVRMLKNSSILLTKGDSRLALVGLDDWKTGDQSLGHVLDGLRPEDTVVVISHSPEAVKQLFVTNAQASSVVDAALTGHTMGGRFALFGRELFNTLDEKDYGAGWQIMGLNARVLIGQGLECNWPPLRFGTRPEVHLLTLRAAN